MGCQRSYSKCSDNSSDCASIPLDVECCLCSRCSSPATSINSPVTSSTYCCSNVPSVSIKLIRKILRRLRCRILLYVLFFTFSSYVGPVAVLAQVANPWSDNTSNSASAPTATTIMAPSPTLVSTPSPLTVARQQYTAPPTSVIATSARTSRPSGSIRVITSGATALPTPAVGNSFFKNPYGQVTAYSPNVPSYFQPMTTTGGENPFPTINRPVTSFTPTSTPSVVRATPILSQGAFTSFTTTIDPTLLPSNVQIIEFPHNPTVSPSSVATNTGAVVESVTDSPTSVATNTGAVVESVTDSPTSINNSPSIAMASPSPPPLVTTAAAPSSVPITTPVPGTSNPSYAKTSKPSNTLPINLPTFVPTLIIVATSLPTTRPTSLPTTGPTEAPANVPSFFTPTSVAPTAVPIQVQQHPTNAPTVLEGGSFTLRPQSVAPTSTLAPSVLAPVSVQEFDTPQPVGAPRSYTYSPTLSRATNNPSTTKIDTGGELLPTGLPVEVQKSLNPVSSAPVPTRREGETPSTIVSTNTPTSYRPSSTFPISSIPSFPFGGEGTTGSYRPTVTTGTVQETTGPMTLAPFVEGGGIPSATTLSPILPPIYSLISFRPTTSRTTTNSLIPFPTAAPTSVGGNGGSDTFPPSILPVSVQETLFPEIPTSAPIVTSASLPPTSAPIVTSASLPPTSAPIITPVPLSPTTPTKRPHSREPKPSVPTAQPTFPLIPPGWPTPNPVTMMPIPPGWPTPAPAAIIPISSALPTSIPPTSMPIPIGWPTPDPTTSIPILLPLPTPTPSMKPVRLERTSAPNVVERTPQPTVYTGDGRTTSRPSKTSGGNVDDSTLAPIKPASGTTGSPTYSSILAPIKPATGATGSPTLSVDLQTFTRYPRAPTFAPGNFSVIKYNLTDENSYSFPLVTLGGYGYEMVLFLSARRRGRRLNEQIINEGDRKLQDISNSSFCIDLWVKSVQRRIVEELTATITKIEALEVAIKKISMITLKSSSALAIFFDVEIKIQSSGTSLTVDELISSMFNSKEEEDTFISKLRNSSCVEFAYVTNVEMVIPPRGTGSNQEVVKQGGNSKTGLIVGIVAAVTAAMMLVFLVAFMRWNGKKKQRVDYAVVTARPDKRPLSAYYEHNDIASEIGMRTAVDVSTISDPVPIDAATLTGGDNSTIDSASIDFDYQKAYQSSNASEVSGLIHDTSREPLLNVAKDNIVIASDEYSIEDQFVFTEAQFEVVAPRGVLGLILETSEEGIPVVNHIKETSVLFEQLQIGDKLLAVDGVDVSYMLASDVSKLIHSKRNQSERRLTFARHVRCRLSEVGSRVGSSNNSSGQKSRRDNL